MIQSETILQLKIPFALASRATAERQLINVYETNKYIKNITAFLILKSESPYGLIKDYQKQIDHLSFITQCERQTFKKRLQWMLQEGIAAIEGPHIRLKSWKEVSALYYCDLTKFKTIQYKPSEQKNIHLHLFASEIEDNKARQSFVIQQKLNKNLALKQTIEAIMLQHGADPSKLSDINYLLNGMRLLYKNSFVAEPEIHALLKDIRPDLNRSVKGLSRAWNYKSKQSASYIKNKLQKAGIARIYKGERITSKERSRNNDCHVIWDDRKLQTVLCLVDTIFIIPQKNLAA